ncbi:MAG: hypothetical protein R2867_02260 [Caldilineaceae bacterium]
MTLLETTVQHNVEQMNLDKESTKLTNQTTLSEYSKTTHNGDMNTLQITDDLDLLLAILPPRIREALDQVNRSSDLIEVILRLGPSAGGRFTEGELYLQRYGSNRG